MQQCCDICKETAAKVAFLSSRFCEQCAIEYAAVFVAKILSAKFDLLDLSPQQLMQRALPVFQQIGNRANEHLAKELERLYKEFQNGQRRR